jgi:hypothetical protein
MQKHGGDPTDAPRYTQVAGIGDITRIERCVINRRLAVRYFIEQKDREVRDDQRDVNDRKPTCRNAVRVRDHTNSFHRPELVVTMRPRSVGTDTKPRGALRRPGFGVSASIALGRAAFVEVRFWITGQQSGVRSAPRGWFWSQDGAAAWFTLTRTHR